MSTNSNKQKLRFRGQFVNEKKLNRRVNIIASTKLRHELNKSIEDERSVVNSTITGRRIVEVNELGKNLKCHQCKGILSLLDIKKERKNGLHSVFSVLCQKCEQVTEVPTGKTHYSKHSYPIADVNSKIVAGKLLS